MLGGLYGYLAEADPRHFQPMNANFGLLPPLDGYNGPLVSRLTGFIRIVLLAAILGAALSRLEGRRTAATVPRTNATSPPDAVR